jgi:succinyl-CoA:acetate CoA-transferase
MHDIYYGLEAPPNRGPIPLVRPGQRIGTPYLQVPAEKIAAIVLTDSPDRNSAFKAPDDASKRIAGHILEFLNWEVQKGRMPANLLPLQSGVGNIANAVLFGLEEGPFEGLTSYTEVIQDGMIRLLKSGKVTSASATAFSLSPQMLNEVNAEMASYRDRLCCDRRRFRTIRKSSGGWA